ncbi:MAG: glycosyltransferase family 2 protein [Bernardetiaceae bacterium]|nr:glycosyltransferase family 2 protein [Bernardetiaceae bacterium]
MKVTGFSFIRNGVRLDYPFVEAVKSVLPLCDDFILAVGHSDDNTLEIASKIDTKIKIIQTVWDDSLKKGGRVLALETDKAFQAICSDTDWCVYIQGDEVLHEKDIPIIKKEMQNCLTKTQIEGLLLNYLHFYGSYDYVGESTNWYRKEIRVVRNNKSIFSFRDAQGFRIAPNRKLNVRHINATMYHYGWVRHPKAMKTKKDVIDSMYKETEDKDASTLSTQTISDEKFDYSNIDSLTYFKGTHPKIIQNRIQAMNWKFEHDISKNKLSLKEKIRIFFEKKFNWIPFEYRNYKVISSYLND